MKKLSIFILFFSNSLFFHAQNFTWVKGPNTAGVAVTPGTMGVAAPANNPGERHGAGKWTDNAGNLWFFGGEGPNMQWWNDLWKYNIATNQWTWVRGSTTTSNTPGVYGTVGVAASSNEPGSREFPATWTDASGNLWMFGGDGYGSAASFGRLGDLWKYDISANQWTWIKGFNTISQNGVYGTQAVSSSSNNPGCRLGAGAWTDASGNFWLYGGRGFAATGLQGYLNDLWKYTVSSNQWTWVSGTNLTGQYGLYGTLGTASSTNAPGARYFPACWIDASNNLYLFGGEGYATSSTNYLNDLWKYDPSANTWVWLKGGSGINAIGVYGTLGTPASANVPGARFSQASWKDASGNFWLFGGYGLPSTTVTAFGDLNDMFRYNPTTNLWTWMKGSNLQNQNGTYGTQGVAAASNMPGAREYNTWWKDLTGKFWLFGGEGYDVSNTTSDHMSDLWSFTVPCSPDSITVSPGKILCSGVTATFSVAINAGAGSAYWYLSAASTVSVGSGATLTLPTSYTALNAPAVYSLFASANDCTVSPRASITLTINPLPALIGMASPSAVCSGDSSTLTISGATTYSWTGFSSTSTNSLQLISAASTSTFYTVEGTNGNGCIDSILVQLQVNLLPTLTVVASPAAVCSGKSATLTASGATTYSWTGFSATNTSSLQVISAASTTTYYTVEGTDVNGCKDTTLVEVQVNPLPILSIAASQKTICVKQSATFTVSGATSYTWDATHLSHTLTVSPTVTTIYTVTGMNTNGCVSTATISEKVDQCTGIQETKISSLQLSIFPNPNNGTFRIRSELEFSEASLNLINALGQKLFEQKISSQETSIHAELPAGIYYYELKTDGGGTAKGKLIIE